MHCDVLIVGLGPVGATLAALLAQGGARVIALDKSAEIYPLPRAAHFDQDIMRVFQQLGIADEVRAHTQIAPAYEFRSASGEILMRFETRTEESGGLASSYMFHQPGLEIALRGLLARTENVEVRLGLAYESHREAADGLYVKLSTENGPVEISTRFLVGCDGASSAVRAACNIALEDLQFDEPWLVIDTLAAPQPNLPTVNLQMCDPSRPTTCVLMGPGRHRWEFMLNADETPADALDDAFIERLLAPWKCDVKLERKAVYRFHGLLAEQWRAGHVLLAGDSAHQMPPFAGQGMCAGIRDAANLSWKLCAVLQGQARAGLLDTYQQERAPHVRQTIGTAIGMGRIVCTRDPVAAAERDKVMLANRAAGVAPPPPNVGGAFAEGCLLAGAPLAGEVLPQFTAAGASIDEVLGPGAWLIGAGSAPGLTAVGLSDPRLAPFRAKLERWLAGAPAVLVRPDRCVFGAGEPKALTAAYEAALGR